jgi:hypothetical protein
LVESRVILRTNDQFSNRKLLKELDLEMADVKCGRENWFEKLKNCLRIAMHLINHKMKSVKKCQNLDSFIYAMQRERFCVSEPFTVIGILFYQFYRNWGDLLIDT